jgi:MFS family permease
MTPVERAARRTFRSLHTRNFRLYFFGQVVSGTGSWMQLVAQAWLVLHLTHSGVALGLTLALQFAPILLAGAWGGVLADRLDKRRLLIATAAASGLLALVLGAVTAAGVVEVWMVYVLAVALGVVTAIDNPARRSFVPEMVPPADVANAVGLNSTVFTAARVVGPAIAGLVIATLGVEWCFLLNGVSFVAVMLALRAMDPAALRAAPTVARREHQLRDGFSYAWRNRPVRLALVVTAVIGMLAFNYQVVLPLMANEELGGGAAAFGTMMAVLGAGSLAGALWVAHYGRASTRIMVRATFVLGATMSAAALAPNLVTELAALAVVGLAAMVLIAMATAICNEATAPELRGRVMAMFSIAFLGSTPIGAPLVGWISESFGPRAGLAIGAVSAFVIATYAFFARRHDRALVVDLTSADVELAESVADAA